MTVWGGSCFSVVQEMIRGQGPRKGVFDQRGFFGGFFRACIICIIQTFSKSWELRGRIRVTYATTPNAHQTRLSCRPTSPNLWQFFLKPNPAIHGSSFYSVWPRVRARVWDVVFSVLRESSFCATLWFWGRKDKENSYFLNRNDELHL